MQPIWHVGGFLLGYIGGLVSANCAMAITAAIEEEIAEHYFSQMESLELHKQTEYVVNLKETITQFRNEEMEHENIGRSYDNGTGGFYSKTRFLTAMISKFAIWLSKKI